MQDILTLPLRQESFFKSKKHEKINNQISYGIIDKSHQLSETTMPSLEDISVTKAKEALLSKVISPKESRQLLSNKDALKEALLIQLNRGTTESLPKNITTIPVFFKIEEQSVELSDSAKETFARIGVRAREAFIEEQIERANLYNIPYQTYGDNHYQLMQDIDKYEFLLEKAQEYCVDWDISEYDPVALEQAIEDAEHSAHVENQELRFYFSLTRGVEL